MNQMMTHGAFATAHSATVEAVRVEPLDLMGLIRSLWNGRWLIMLTTALAIVASGYYAFGIAQPRFAATATLHVSVDRHLAGDNAGLGGSQPVNVTTEAAILQSNYLLGQVIDQLDLSDDPAFNRYLIPVRPWSVTGIRTRLRNTLTGQVTVAPDDAAVAAKTLANLRSTITARARPDSNIFDISVTTGSAGKSILIANTLASAYLADQMDVQFAATDRAVTWLSEKVYEQQLALTRKETTITDLIAQTHMADEALLDAMSREALETDQRLRDARDALARLTDGDPDPALASTATLPLGDNVRRLTGQIAALETARKILADEMAGQSAGLTRLHQLQREADATRILYETFLSRLQEVTLQRGLQDPDSRILNVAGPAHYVAPRKMLVLAIGALLGVLAGIAWVFLREATQRGFRDAGALGDMTGRPVFAQLSLMKLRRPSGLLDHLGTARAAPTLDAVGNLRTALLLGNAEDPPQCILCTSSVAGEGKTMLAITLAKTLGGLGKSVLLLDGDLRSSGVAKYLDAVSPYDLKAVVRGDVAIETAVVRDARWAVDVISGECDAPDAADIFAGAGFANTMHRLRERYDYIVIDAPPVLPVPDARVLAQHADAVVYAVRWNKTPVNLVMAGQRELENVHAPVTGQVLTQMDLRQMRKLGRADYVSAVRAGQQQSTLTSY